MRVVTVTVCIHNDLGQWISVGPTEEFPLIDGVGVKGRTFDAILGSLNARGFSYAGQHPFRGGEFLFQQTIPEAS